MGVQLSLNKTYIEKTMEAANKRGMKRYSGDENPEKWLLWEFDEEPEIEIDLDHNYLCVHSINTPVGDVDLSIDLSADVQISLLEMFVKRLNKIKTLMESLK